MVGPFSGGFPSLEFPSNAHEVRWGQCSCGVAKGRDRKPEQVLDICDDTNSFHVGVDVSISLF